MSRVLIAQSHQQQNHDVNSNYSIMQKANSTISTAIIAHQQQQQHNINSNSNKQHHAVTQQ